MTVLSIGLDFYLNLEYNLNQVDCRLIQLRRAIIYFKLTKEKIMGNFNRDDRRGGGRSGGFGGRDKGFGGGHGTGGRPQMHQAMCSKCNKECEVPFRPTGDRPVFCNDCFRSQGLGRTERPARQDFGRSNFDNDQKQRITGSQNIEQFRSQFEVLNVKLDKILRFLTPAATVVATSKIEEPKEKNETKKVKETVAKKSAIKKAAVKKKK
ncbi:MAG: hypothetical protein UT86_C0001G0211 [Candidatus Magasanikbacteria bacterium GW2011_GWC2_40_17]|uniref:CxxC-x17-CxxC domain-containing protein n=1 Tax=Candidatus Magasanikbacteria bacterium GW2011_GWA2_42_32 TaxID=1619039 RepID=A0A0G1CG82_9BACT|nr:MAG: hypothetical protein UT86_C0001G0211 [Candidatus Magasanikbacteria bacterium GW2011_GWC2_40_17]KKS57571.1 MAG: hypothetical protein UV20_C0001G0211 [Candidatus Magasanikbacteria bacterium GW2011_GWA2_42_32]OGH85446.1 MAG: hypothetical protein A2294_03515 [Candidatus Magasanikbacteria bacterium RIFOXYB2_FULL_38_10]